MHAPCGNVASYCGGGGIGLKREKRLAVASLTHFIEALFGSDRQSQCTDDLNNGGPISTDFIGGSDRYPNASYAERAQIFQQHKFYTQVSAWN